MGGVHEGERQETEANGGALGGRRHSEEEEKVSLFVAREGESLIMKVQEYISCLSAAVRCVCVCVWAAL